METIIASKPFLHIQLSFTNRMTYLFAILFIIGNLLLPQLTHTIPKGGLIFLPIYFFTLIGAYKFGINVGLLTACLSPLVNHWLFGMPPVFVLPIILIKSTLLAIAASIVAAKFKSLSIWSMLIVVLIYQSIGFVFEYFITNSFEKAFQDVKIGLPGLIIQIIGGYLLLKLLSNYELKKLGRNKRQN
jgi:hypothetical protein